MNFGGDNNSAHNTKVLRKLTGIEKQLDASGKKGDDFRYLFFCPHDGCPYILHLVPVGNNNMIRNLDQEEKYSEEWIYIFNASVF